MAGAKYVYQIGKTNPVLLISSLKNHFTCHTRKSTVCTILRGITTTPFPEFQGDPQLKSHADLYNASLQNPDHFWGTLAKSRLQWFQTFNQIKDCDINQGHIRWFMDGKLNASVNCVDRYAEKNGDAIALIWEKDEPGTEEFVSYRQLSQMVNKMANLLKSSGVGRGDRVAIYLPTSPIAVAAMMACARIGAIHSVVFAGFSAEALAGRIVDADAETVITADEGVRGGKTIPLKQTVDAAVAQCPCVKRVFVYQRTGNPVPMTKLDIPLDKEMERQSDVCEPEEMGSEDLLFMLYTSGSTGKPKGIAHSTAGYLLYAGITQKNPAQTWFFKRSTRGRAPRRGFFQIRGEKVYVINVSGHRIGTAEVEDAMDNHSQVAETAVVGYPHDIKGEGIYAFVVPMENVSPEDADTLKAELNLMVKTSIGSFAQPDKILFTPGLPKTRSGKIMRRILRKVADNKPDELGDISTLVDPSVVEILVQRHSQEFQV
ncbi:acetyl-coenzyme A synthetase 2-like, mitochondrial [Pecten maximus]|uniref:acetyl-coenzyme A synthetase 2-like, mitochondrial n=1 Tax=Pecten maximus TaxID=6579 RepID=UPI001457F4CE|nr:acetyl-coenzyme A synthetase 2-like, mitochondrial [Pecten maximus]